MPELKTIARIQAKNVNSLVWNDDQLIDWVGGGTRFELDGTVTRASVYYPFRFDAVCSSPDNEYAVIYERLGTKGLLLRNGKIHREFNRSYYHATAYEFPVCLALLPSGRVVLIHCPDEYNQIEIDDVESGARLTQVENRDPIDFFHSRFVVSDDGRYLLSAGWVWHPFDTICVFDLELAISSPTSLDTSTIFPAQSTETASATFQGKGRLILCTSDETFSDDDFEENELRPSSVCIWDVNAAKIHSQVAAGEPIGTLMPVGDDYVVGFYEHPKLVSLGTGQVVSRIPEMESGKQNSSIIHHVGRIPPIAIDACRRRFAIATDEEIVVVAVEI